MYFALLLNSERISIVSKNKGGIIKMKAKKGLAAAITAVSVAAATVISAGAIGLGASGSMTEFYFAGDEEIEIALEEQITLASGSKVTLSALYLLCSACRRKQHSRSYPHADKRKHEIL